MKTIADIMAIREKMQSQIKVRDNCKTEETQIIVGMGTCGISAGASEVFNTLVEEVSINNIPNVKVSRTGCLGNCSLEPVVEIQVPGKDKVTYAHMDSEKAKKVVKEHILKGNVVNDYLA